MGHVDGREPDELIGLTLLLDFFSYSMELDKRVWGSGKYGVVFNYRSFFDLFSKFFFALPLNTFYWKAKVPLKARVTVLNRVNTNYLRWRWGPNTMLSPDVCVMCLRSGTGSLISFFFSSCSLWRIWNRVFGIFDGSVGVPS